MSTPSTPNPNPVSISLKRPHSHLTAPSSPSSPNSQPQSLSRPSNNPRLNALTPSAKDEGLPYDLEEGEEREKKRLRGDDTEKEREGGGVTGSASVSASGRREKRSDRSRSRDRDHDRDRRRDRDRDRDRDRHHSSRHGDGDRQSDRDRHRSSRDSHRDGTRDKDRRDREQDREERRDRDVSRDTARSAAGSASNYRSGDRDRNRNKDRERDRDSGRDRERERDRHRERDGDRERYSSRSERDERRREEGRDDRDRRERERNGDRRERDGEKERERRGGGEARQESVARGNNNPTASATASQAEAPITAFPANISKPPSSPSKPTLPTIQEPQPQTLPDEEPPAPVDVELTLEERRRRRREILEKFAGIQSGVNTGVGSVGSVTSVGSGRSEGVGSGLQVAAEKLGLASSTFSHPESRATPPVEVNSTTGEIDLTKGSNGAALDKEEVLPVETTANEVGGEEQISAADYNPDEDRKLDESRKQLHQHAPSKTAAAIKQEEIASGLGEPVAMEVDEESEYEEVEIDAEEDEDFDMFAMDEAPKKKTIRRKKQKANKPIVPPPQTKPTAAELLDNYDDAEGYYRLTPGEFLDNGRYKVTVTLGKGMFAAVVRAIVVKPVEGTDKVGQEVAIKVIRSQESMYVAGRKEAQILGKLAAADPDDKKHIVRLLRTFEHRGHLCIVTENLSMNLRDVVKRFGKDVGLNLRAVRAYAHQMFLALSLMKKCNIIHADLKPDNILVSENKAVLKVCDLGSACDANEADITPYLVSRFYRAPEIILGLPYDDAIDMWSIGCTLYELYTGKILFPGRSNNQMLHLMMDLKGKFNHRMIKKAQFGEMHFDEAMNFVSVDKDKITGQDVIKSIVITKATRDLRTRLIPSSTVLLKMKDEDAKLLQHFVDLLEKALTLDPAKRLSAREALLHPFLTSV